MVRPAPQYRLTNQGQAFRPVIDALYSFGVDLLPKLPLNPAKVSYFVESMALRNEREVRELAEAYTVTLAVDDVEVLVELAPGVLRTVEDGEPASSVRLSLAELMSCASGSRPDDSVIGGEIQQGRQLLSLLCA